METQYLEKIRQIQIDNLEAIEQRVFRENSVAYVLRFKYLAELEQEILISKIVDLCRTGK
jgi:hypothetical protein